MPELVAGLAVAPPFTPEPAHPADPIDAELWKRWREFCRIHSEPGWERFCAVYAVHEANLAAEAARLEAELRQLPPFERFVP